MSFTLWRGVVGMVRPTRRPGTLEELIRILPEGIGVVPLLLNFKAGSNAEFLASIPQYEHFASELAEQGVDVIMLTGAPPFMLLGPEKGGVDAGVDEEIQDARCHRPANAGRGAARDEN
jgi:maleate isomerase